MVLIDYLAGIGPSKRGAGMNFVGKAVVFAADAEVNVYQPGQVVTSLDSARSCSRVNSFPVTYL